MTSQDPDLHVLQGGSYRYYKRSSFHPGDVNNTTKPRPKAVNWRSKTKAQRESWRKSTQALRKGKRRWRTGAQSRSNRTLSHSEQTRHQPGRQGGAPVARERWIGGWEAAALALRLLVLNSGRYRCQAPGTVAARVSFQRGRGVRARAGAGRAGLKRSLDSARTAYLP